MYLQKMYTSWPHQLLDVLLDKAIDMRSWSTIASPDVTTASVAHTCTYIHATFQYIHTVGDYGHYYSDYR